MKTKSIAAFIAGLLVSAVTANAADILKLSTGDYDSGSGWEGGVFPGDSNVGVFDSSTVPTGAGASFDASANVAICGLKFTNIQGPVTLTGSSSSTRTVGTSGLDMSAATADVTFSSGYYRLSANGGLNVASGRTFTIYNGSTSANIYTYTFTGGGTFAVTGTWTGGNRLALNVDGSSTIAGTGTFKPNNNSSGNGITINSGSSISPGIGGIGTLTLDSAGDGRPLLSMVNGSMFKFDLGTGGTYASPGTGDLLVFANMVAGEATFNSNTIDFLGTGSVGVFKLFDSDLAAVPASDA